MIRDCLFGSVTKNQGVGVELTNVQNGVVENNLFVENAGGVSVHLSSDITITGNRMTGLSSNGFQVEDSSYITISDNTVNVMSSGIYFSGVTNTTVRNNYVTNSTSYGIYSYNSDDLSFKDNFVRNASNNGFHLNLGSDLFFENNTAHLSIFYGFSIVSATNLTMIGSTATNSTNRGIIVSGSESIKINDTICYYNGDDGLSVITTNNAWVTGGVLHNNTGDGFFADTVENLTLSNINSYSNDGSGYYPRYITNMVMSHCNSTANANYGIRLENSKLVSIDNLQAELDSNSRIYLYTSNNITITNSVFNSGSVGTSAIYGTGSHNISISDVEIYGGNSHAIWIDGDNVDITRLYVHDCFSYAAFLYGDNVTIVDSTVVDTNFGFGLSTSSHSIIYNNYIENTQSYGVYVLMGTDTIVNNNIINGSRGTAFFASNPTYLQVVNNYIESPSDYGISVSGGSHILLRNNTINKTENAANSAVRVVNSPFIVIRDNVITNSASHGIEIQNSINSTIHNNRVDHSTQTGIYVSGCENTTVSHNEVSFNGVNGIQLVSSHNSSVIFNTVYNHTAGGANSIVFILTNTTEVLNNTIFNGVNGIYMASNSHQNQIYYNVISQCSSTNAYDDGTQNVWDDGTVLGNYWDDYDFVSPYNISGGAGSQDRYPQSSIPICNHPPDRSISEGSTGYNITWLTSGRYLDTYYLYRNSSLIETGAWNHYTFVISLDGLVKGLYNYTLVLKDSNGETATDTVWIWVSDTTAPTLSEPSDLNIEYGTVGNSIVWTGVELHPDSYVVFRNGTVIMSGPWDGSSITVNVDGLLPGIYNYSVFVNDTSSNSDTDLVFVTVSDTVAPAITPISDVEFENGLTGNDLVWDVDELLPDMYNITMNGTLIVSGTYTDNVTYNVDAYSSGHYLFVVYVNDTSGNSASSSVMVTIRPNAAPVLDHPDDIEYEYGAGSYQITWHGDDVSPNHYWVYRNGTVVIEGAWAGEAITVDVSGGDVGSYNYTIRLLDDLGNSATDTVIVTVVDTTPPTIDSPDDVTYTEGETGNEITWTISDLRPDELVVFVDGAEVHRENWTSGTYTYSVDGLDAGDHNITVVVYDASGNWVSDTVIVHVLQSTSTTTTATTTTTSPTTNTGTDTTQPPDQGSPMMVVALVGAAIVVSVIVFLFRFGKISLPHGTE